MKGETMQPNSLKPCAFVPRDLVDKTLTTAPTQGKKLLEPLKRFGFENGLPFNILEDVEVKNEAEVHRHEGDLWHCLEGEVTFVYGGRMVKPWAKKLPQDKIDDREIKANEIADGTHVVMKPGDWLWIPAGQPHQHWTNGLARLVIIKIPAQEPVPLEAVPGWVG